MLTKIDAQTLLLKIPFTKPRIGHRHHLSRRKSHLVAVDNRADHPRLAIR